MAFTRPSQTAPRSSADLAALDQLRWVFLAGILLTAGLTGRMSSPLAGVCTLYGLWLVWQSLRARNKPRPTWLDIGGVAADAILAVAAVVVTGGLLSPLWWALLLPAAPGGFLFGLWTGVGVSVVAWAGAAGMGLAQATQQGAAVGRTPALIGGGLLVASLAAAWLGAHLSGEEDAPQDAWSEIDEPLPANLGEVLLAAARLNETTALDQLGLRIIDLARSVLSNTGPGPLVRPAGLWIGTPDDGDWALTVGFAPEPLGRGTSDGSAVFEAMRSGEPRVVDSPGEDPFVGQWPGLESSGRVVIVPLTLPSGASLGAVLMGVHWVGAPPAGVIDQLRAVGSNGALVWEKASRYQALLEEKDQLNELQEEARRRLARNLHDGPTQTIASIAMRANFARRQITRDPDVAEQEVAKVEEMARQTTREIRHMLFTLRPLILESQGLGPALYQLALKARDSHDEDIQLEIDPETTSGMELGVQGALFYIVEEAVTNAQKHAAAEHIWIRLKQATDGLRLEVEDDGVGFNVGAVDANYEQRGSLGMVNMRERAELAGGVLSVKSTEGQGTCISVSLPSAVGADTPNHD